jgi:hypothetical protein
MTAVAAMSPDIVRLWLRVGADIFQPPLAGLVAALVY